MGYALSCSLNCSLEMLKVLLTKTEWYTLKYRLIKMTLNPTNFVSNEAEGYDGLFKIQ